MFSIVGSWPAKQAGDATLEPAPSVALVSFQQNVNLYHSAPEPGKRRPRILGLFEAQVPAVRREGPHLPNDGGSSPSGLQLGDH